MSDEPVIWKSRPSQLTNFWTFVGAALLAVAAVVGGFFFPYAYAGLAIPFALAFWSWLVVRCRVYELTTQRLRFYTGVLNRHIDEIELYRVKDTCILQPFWLRIFGLGTLELDTSDRTMPKAHITAVRDATAVREKLRANVERLRDLKRVRELDFDSADEMDGDIDLT